MNLRRVILRISNVYHRYAGPFYRPIDNWHKHPLLSPILCAIGRHDWEGPAQIDIGIGRVMLECFYCSARKSTNRQVLEKLTCPECYGHDSEGCPLCEGRGSVTITENNAWLLGDKEGAKAWGRTLDG